MFQIIQIFPFLLAFVWFHSLWLEHTVTHKNKTDIQNTHKIQTSKQKKKHKKHKNTGTPDDTAYLSMQAALDFRSEYGDKAIKNYIHNLAVNGGNILKNKWDTNLLFNNDYIGAMVNVQLPKSYFYYCFVFCKIYCDNIKKNK